MRRTRFALVAGVLLALFGLPSVASAAPSVLSSNPEDGATEHEAPAEVTITFDMPLDPSASGLVVVDECGRRVDADDATVTVNEIKVSIARTPSGVYEARYKATPPAGATGSSSGSISFTVHAGKPCSGGMSGGHGNHGGHEPGGGGGQHSGGGHSGNEHPGDGHSSSGHTSTSHEDSDHSGTGHTTSGHSGSGDHTGGKHGDKHGSTGEGHGGHGGGSGVSAAPPIAAPRIPDLGGTTVPASTIALSLGLCLLMGLAGGWFVRNSGVR